MEIIKLAVCRLCAQCKSPDKIVGQINSTELDIESKLVVCCQWNTIEGAQSNEMPQNVCIACYTSLNQSWDFTERVRCAQIELRAKLILQNMASASARKIKTKLCDDDYDDEDVQLNSTAQPNYIDLKEEPEIQACSPLSIREHSNDFDPMEQIDEFDVFDCAKDDEKSTAIADDIVSIIVEDIDTDKFRIVTEFNENKFLKSIEKVDRNADGSIKPEAVQRLGFDNWSIIQYKCYLCKLQLPDHYEWRSHIKIEHPGQPFRHLCNICNTKDYKQRKPLFKHVVSNHRRYFKFW